MLTIQVKNACANEDYDQRGRKLDAKTKRAEREQKQTPERTQELMIKTYTYTTTKNARNDIGVIKVKGVEQLKII